MSLDLSLSVRVHNTNLTHNLTKMASEVPVGTTKIYKSHNEYEIKELSLYDVMWRPDEYYLSCAADVVDYYKAGLHELLNHPDKYKEFNPPNGWGEYSGLVGQLTKLIASCEIHPSAYLEADR